MAIARARYHDVKGPGAEAQQGEFGKMHIEVPRLRLGQNSGGIAALNAATLEDLAKGVDPLAFDAIGKHPGGPSARLNRCNHTQGGVAPTTPQPASGNPRSNRLCRALKAALRLSPSSEMVISGTNMSTV
jgi:hypothetical protein